MNCTWSTKEMIINNTRLWKVTDTDSGRYVYIPYREAFEYIRYRMDPLEGHGNRIEDAYELAGGRYTDYLPEEHMLPCIKLIYTNFQVLNQNGVEVFQPFGNWVFDEACKCLQQQTDTSRMDLGDGFIVPNKTEWACIIDKMFNGGMNFAGAVFTCAPDITYPREIIGYLEDAVKANTEVGYPRYNIIRNAHSGWKQIFIPISRITLDNGLVVPSSDEIDEIEIGLNYGMNLTESYFNICNDILPPENMRQCIEDKIRNTSSTWIDIFKSCQGESQDGNQTLYYVLAGIAALLLFSSKG